MNMRKATLEDVTSLHKLINGYAKDNIMLPRSLNEIYDNVRDFWVIEENGEVVACAALHPTWEDMAEVKSLAVSQEHQHKNYATRLVKACLDECKTLRVNKVFALTYVPGFFEKVGFTRDKKESMPHKIWSECIKCPYFPDCNEVLMVKKI
ncbi:MAG: N-acetyltransferase [Elusimicrobia bacterium]|nr:N-acetyltransferase [Elusimicrobiota bacterium]